MQKVWGILSVAFIMALLFPLVAVIVFISYFSDSRYIFPFAIAAYISLGGFLVMARFELHRFKKFFFIGSGVLMVIALLFVTPELYDKTRKVISDGSIEVADYEPFQKNTKAVKLDEPATLKIDRDLPVIDGATALYPIYSAFAQAVYPENDYPVYGSEVMSNRTGQAYTNVINGTADIAFVLGPSANQLKQAENAGRELTFTPIGKEAFVFFVNSKNPVESLEVDELKGIYAGKITNWNDVGGKSETIRAFQRPENSGSQTALQKFMGTTVIMKPPTEDIASLMGTVIGEVADYKNHNNAIGYTFRYYSTQMVKNNNIRLLNVNGVEPTVETIRSGEYPITHEFYAVTAGSENPHVEAFLEWILSEQGQDIIEKTGYVPIRK